jgi:hypothetical protein
MGAILSAPAIAGEGRGRPRCHPPPRQRGRGTTLRSRVVEGAQDSTRRTSLRDVSTFSLAHFFMRKESSATATKLRVLRPLHHGSLAARAPVVPLPRFAGADGASFPVPAAHLRPSFADRSHEAFASKTIRGGGAPKRRDCLVEASPRDQMLPPARASGAAARSAERARLSALHRGARLGQLPKLDPGRASRDAARRRYPRLGVALKRSTSRAGRNAGGVDARTARERQ